MVRAMDEDTQRTAYADIAFDDHVRARQRAVGAGNRIDPDASEPFEFHGVDRKLIREADFFFLATVTGSGWPYVQHKGGPPGFVHVLDERTLAYPDFPGNLQYVSAGNIDRDGRVCLFFVDFPTRRRLKVFGRARAVEAADDPELMERLRAPSGAAAGSRPIRTPIERAIVVEVDDVDANCTRHIKPRWNAAAVDARIDLYRADIRDRDEKIADLEAGLAQRDSRIADLEARLADLEARPAERDSRTEGLG